MAEYLPSMSEGRPKFNLQQDGDSEGPFLLRFSLWPSNTIQTLNCASVVNVAKCKYANMLMSRFKLVTTNFK